MTAILPKTQILMLLRFGRQQELHMVEQLSEAERNAAERHAFSDSEPWTAKDFLGNILLWKEMQTQKLATILRGETPPVWTERAVIEPIDGQGFIRFKDSNFQEVLAEGERVYGAFIAQVDRLSDEELNDPLHFSWQQGEPVRGETLGNGLWHPCAQLTAFYLQSGRKSAAMQLQEELLATVRQADMPPENFGFVVYNAACFYATNNCPEQALPLLSEALRLRPTLVEWSQHDTDLDTLRTNPAFQAIYDDPAVRAHAPVSALVSADELRDLGEGVPAPVIIDVRGSDEFASGHIEGAINIPLGLLERQFTSIPADRPIVTYCNMHHRGESRGERAAAQLRERGVDARTLDGGYPGWKDRGLPVE